MYDRAAAPPRRSGLVGKRRTRRRLNWRSTLISRRAARVPIGLIGIERANFATADGIVMSNVTSRRPTENDFNDRLESFLRVVTTLLLRFSMKRVY